ncbi:MAG: hypothetical protein NTU98_04485 [Bacteroidetes bacterium]|nr:hypothetical protein [Bacteroidota bacterium]
MILKGKIKTGGVQNARQERKDSISLTDTRNTEPEVIRSNFLKSSFHYLIISGKEKMDGVQNARQKRYAICDERYPNIEQRNAISI